MKKVDIIVPVYKGLEETQRCIMSAASSVDRAIGGLIVINDNSPDPKLVDWLKISQHKYGFTLLNNENNLGFVATANRGMQLHQDHDVLLLNSDVEVSGDWLTRMRECAYQHNKVASITPFSNNATICSFPNFCEDNELALGLSLKHLDDHFSSTFSPTDVVEIPTGVGFCMYIRRDCLNEIGYFDAETFGKGYGEENDWCQRAEKSGWKNYHQANVFVYHIGGVSFDLQQEPGKAKALELLIEKHPDYEGKIQAFTQLDPAKKMRTQALWTLYAESSLPKVLCITHQLGGGVQHHINELAIYYLGQALILRLMPTGDGNSVKISITNADGAYTDSVSYDIDSDYDRLIDLLNVLGVGKIHYHHTMGLHHKLLSLPQELDCQYIITVHDYYFVNGNPTLTDANGRFVGDAPVQELDKICKRACPIPVTGEQWRENLRPFISQAERVIFPSSDTHIRFTRYFEVKTPIVAWHPDHMHTYPETSFKLNPQRPLRVLIIGALSREKGADLLEKVATHSNQDIINFHLLGYAYRDLSKYISTTGPYDNKYAHEHINTIAPDVIWFPALCPETYSYTLSLALESGLPIVVPNIGAFAERVQERTNSSVVPWNLSTREWIDLWEEVVHTGQLPISIVTSSKRSTHNMDFYPNSYLPEPRKSTVYPIGTLLDILQENQSPTQCANTLSEKILRYIWTLNRIPLVSKALKLVPISWKNAIKQRLSSRPKSEIISGNNII